MDYVKLLSETLLEGRVARASFPTRATDRVPVLLGVALLLALVFPQVPRMLLGQNDFAALYAGGKLAGTPDLYSRQANEALIAANTGVTMDSVVYTRPPFYAAVLKPLAWLPYRAAYGVFVVLCLASIVWFVWRFSGDCPALPLVASFCVPAAIVFPQGQDTPFLLLFIGAHILFLRRGWDFFAGLVLALCAIKFHLFLLVPWMLLLRKAYRTLAGLLAGSVMLFSLGAAVSGYASTGQYVRTLLDPYINFHPGSMANLHGLISGLHPDVRIEMALHGLVALAFLWVCRKWQNYELLFGLSIVCGLLVSYHSGFGDNLLLLPAFVLLIRSGHRFLRLAVGAAISPLPYLGPLRFTLPPVLLLILALAVATALPRAAEAGLVRLSARETGPELHI